MRIEKQMLNDALRVLGKAVYQTSPVELYRSVRFVGVPGNVRAMVTDGVEVVSVKVESDSVEPVDFCVEFKVLRELVRVAKDYVELQGKFIEAPEMVPVPEDAVTTVLPAEVSKYLELVAPIVNKAEYRRVLQGINLSPYGVTATDGKQMLHLPVPMTLKEDITIPFPSALLAARLSEAGLLQTWQHEGSRVFKFQIGSFEWYGRVIDGIYPAWRNIIPTDKALDCTLTLHEPAKVIEWLKMIPVLKTTNGIRFEVEENIITLSSTIHPAFELQAEGTFNGTLPENDLSLDRDILLRMLTQGYTTLKWNSKGSCPVLASGGHGHYVAMPLRYFSSPKTSPTVQPQQEEKKMESENINVVEQQNAAPVANPLDDLNANVEEFRGKLKLLLDESSVLIRKVKEVALQQKQKERDFIQAKRAIERIRMAI